MLRHCRGGASGTWVGVALACLLGCNQQPDTLCIGGPHCPDAGLPELAPDASTYVVRPGQACAMQSVRATRGPGKTVDVIFVVDNSASMVEEIAAVRENINQNFAAIVQQSAVDLRVILLSLYGSGGTSICIGPPLAGAECNAGLWATNSDTFFHYSVDIESNDSFCRILETFDQPDAAARAPNGWQDWLRPDSQKAFVVITDDSARCTYHPGESQVEFGAKDADPFEDALRFHEALLAKSPEQFGVPPEIKYQFFSIVGLLPKPVATTPLFPYEDLQSMGCDTAPTPGLSYQALSIITDALRYPVCEGRSFDSVFQVLARSVIAASKEDCAFELPEPPDGQKIDLSTVNLQYRSSDGDDSRFLQVDSSAACKNDHSFYVAGRIELCPQACAVVQGDPAPEVNILYACEEHVD